MCETCGCGQTEPPPTEEESQAALDAALDDIAQEGGSADALLDDIVEKGG